MGVELFRDDCNFVVISAPSSRRIRELLCRAHNKAISRMDMGTEGRY